MTVFNRVNIVSPSMICYFCFILLVVTIFKLRHRQQQISARKIACAMANMDGGGEKGKKMHIYRSMMHNKFNWKIISLNMPTHTHTQVPSSSHCRPMPPIESICWHLYNLCSVYTSTLVSCVSVSVLFIFTQRW